MAVVKDDRTPAPEGEATPTLGGQVFARRKALGWSQEGLAFRAGVSTSTVRLIEKDARPSFRRSTLRALSSALWDDADKLDVVAAA